MSPRNLFLRIAFSFAMVMFCVLGAKGQTTGLYFIANNNTNAFSPTDPTNNWYLVPASNSDGNGGIANVTIDKWTWNNDANTPLVTTYKTQKDDNSVWAVVKSGDNYYLIHVLTGKYMTRNEGVGTNSNRRTFHMETNASPGNDALFNIISYPNKTYYSFNPITVTSGHRFMNPSNGNKATYYASATSDGGYTVGGTIGLYDKDAEGDAGSKWFMETSPLLSAPVITVNSTTGSCTITWRGLTVSELPSGYVIRYTVDGSDPVTDPNNTAEAYDGNPIYAQQNNTNVKAVVIGHHDMQLTAIASETFNPAPPEAPTFEMLCESSLLQINCNNPMATKYYNYTTNGTDPADPDNNNGTLYSGPISLPNGAKVKAVAYNGSNPTPSPVSEVYTVINYTPSPSVNLTETQAEIAFGTDVTIHYTTDGTEPDPSDTGETTSPITITGLSYDADLVLRVIATSSGYNNSCPETVVKRPKQPTINPSMDCVGATAIHTLTFSDTEEGKTYWYALSNGQNQSAPALNTFTEYTPGEEVDITAIPTWNGTDIWVTLHAYAKTADGFESHVVWENYQLKHTDAPTISHTGNTVTIAPPSTAPTATIHYTDNGGPVQTYYNPFTVAEGQNHIIVATAQYGSEGTSCEVVEIIALPQTITTLSQLNNMTFNGAYVLGADIEDASSYTTTGTDADPFTGSFDGAGYTISGLTQPLFGTTNNAVVHDVNLKGVNITSSFYSADTVGAIACVAKGYTRIYSCGILPGAPEFGASDHPGVSAADCAGSIVGSLRDDSRVINCFSFADVNAPNSAAGIVGFNQCESDASVSGGKYHKLRTMVMNCMYYGDVTSASTYPVYGGRKISNAGANAINNYNFYSDSCSFTPSLQSAATHYYCSWPAKYEYLTRYEFHRYLLNSNRELCGWWVGAPFAPSTMTTANVQAVPKDASLMAKWVLDRSVAPFPILKPFGKYPSPINIDANADWRTSANEWEGKKLGTLSVTVNPGTHAATGVTGTTLNDVVITDMDTIHGDYCYRKIQLPYYNSVFGNPNGDTWAKKYGGNYDEYVVTGWEITSTNGWVGAFKEDWQDGYNFASRDSTAKDLYSVSGRVFAQGGYYYVPYDVTEITITAHWGKAVYLGNGDYYYDRVDFSHDTNKPGTPFAPAGTRVSTLGNDKTIQTGKIATVANSLPTSGTVYDNALVLVGNHQYCTGGEDVAPSRSFTIMSADFDCDNEPDYCLIWQLGVGTTRQSICPIRFDFLPVVEIGLGLKRDGSTQYYSLGCYRPLGHYEVTETTLIRFGQFEFGNVNRPAANVAPLILNGGIFEQYVKGTKAITTANDRINYVIIGGNIYMPSFTPGAHVNGNAAYPTRHCAVNAIGGRYDKFYLTGNYNESVTPNSDNPHCYIDGGWFGQVAAAGTEGIDGDVCFRINHARISEFYGGSTLDNKLVTGNIDVTIDSSRVVDIYCGGPKFGNMNLSDEHPENNKTITTRAKGTFFNVYYGGGNGGTSYVQYKNTDGEQTVSSYNWYNTNSQGGYLNQYHPGEYRSEANNYMADYDMSIVNVSTGTNPGKAVFRTYFHAAQFSATNTGPITNELNGCIVKHNFYGGGNLGGVKGNVTSMLNNTEVRGSAYGAGFSASVPDVTIHQRDKTEPTIDVYTGNISPTPVNGGPSHHSTTYTWCYKNPSTDVVTPEGVNIPNDVGTNNPGFEDEESGKNYFYTTVSLENLGTVTGNVTFTLKGSTEVSGNVFGGGDMSKVSGNTTIKIQEGTHVHGNVYGGGNEGEVGGDSEVIIQDVTNP